MPTVLMVNNHTAAREMLCLTLRSRGYNMLEASNIQAGLNLINQQHPDLVICDHEPPDLDGINFLQTLRLNSATAAIPLIVCTSQADPQVKQLALQLGVCAYINKPFDLHLLTDLIAAQLHQKGLSPSCSGVEVTSPISNLNGNSIAKTDSTKISGTSLAWSYFTAMVGE